MVGAARSDSLEYHYFSPREAAFNSRVECVDNFD